MRGSFRSKTGLLASKNALDHFLLLHRFHPEQERRYYEGLVQALPRDQAVHVAQLLQSLLQAQYGCELMASRGVRVAKDITSEWSRLTGGLLDRIEGYEMNCQALKQKVGALEGGEVSLSHPSGDQDRSQRACTFIQTQKKYTWRPLTCPLSFLPSWPLASDP